MMSSMQMAIVGWDEPRTDWKKDTVKLTKVEAHWRSKHFLFDTNVWPDVSAWASESIGLSWVFWHWASDGQGLDGKVEKFGTLGKLGKFMDPKAWLTLVP